MISKLTEAEKGAKDSPAVTKKPEESPRHIRRGNNFSQLLQKFSASDASSSERSDTESPRGRKILLRRQEACAVSSGSSDETRRTPERTQSLKLQNKESLSFDKDKDSSGSSVQRSSSFKSDFMRRRFSPEPDSRRRLPETPEQSDKPSPELAKVLTKRNEIVAKQQEDGDVLERERIHDGKVEKAERFSAAGNEEVIMDSEVLQMLKSRRKETDSSLESSTSVSESEDRPQSKSSARHVADKPSQPSADLASPTLSQTQSSRSAITLQLTPQSSVEQNVKTVEEKALPPASHLDTEKTSAKEIKKTEVPKLDLASIDTSLNVLQTVTDDLQDKHSGDKVEKYTSELSHVNIKSPTQVADFIHSVEKDMDSKEIKEEKIETKEKISDTKERLQTDSQSSDSSQTKGTIDITSKSEIMKKISSRDRSPERQSPKRTGPMKVLSPLRATHSSGKSSVYLKILNSSVGVSIQLLCLCQKVFGVTYFRIFMLNCSGTMYT